jgi:hypothetical protein
VAARIRNVFSLIPCRIIRGECTTPIELAVLYIYGLYNLESQGTLQALEAKEPSTLGAKKPIHIRTYLNIYKQARICQFFKELGTALNLFSMEDSKNPIASR